MAYMKDWNPTQESFGRFLTWLHPEIDEAAQTYERVRHRLIVFFNCRGCQEPDDLADKTINRVISQIDDLITNYQGDPTRYFHGVARYIHLEYLRSQRQMTSEPISDTFPSSFKDTDSKEREVLSNCLEECLKRLSEKKRELFICYYRVEGSEKVDYRATIAKRFGYTVTALRLQIHRLRNEMRACITDCQSATAPV